MDAMGCLLPFLQHNELPTPVTASFSLNLLYPETWVFYEFFASRTSMTTKVTVMIFTMIRFTRIYIYIYLFGCNIRGRYNNIVEISNVLKASLVVDKETVNICHHEIIQLWVYIDCKWIKCKTQNIEDEVITFERWVSYLIQLMRRHEAMV